MSTVEGWTTTEFKAIVDTDSDSDSDSDSDTDSDSSDGTVTRGYRVRKFKKIAFEEDLLPE